MLQERRLVHGTQLEPLAVMERHTIFPFDYNFSESRVELQRRLDEERRNNPDLKSWGYFPESPYTTSEQYPETAKLVSNVERYFIGKLGDAYQRAMKVAFIRLAPEDPSKDGEMHVDVGRGVEFTANHRERKPGEEILRGLLNLGSEPRRLIIATSTADQLRAKGLEISDDAYKPIQLPEGEETSVISIPGRQGNTVHALFFLANRVPHVGEEEPHFLVSFGTYAQRNYKLGITSQPSYNTQWYG